VPCIFDPINGYVECSVKNSNSVIVFLFSFLRGLDMALAEILLRHHKALIFFLTFLYLMSLSITRFVCADFVYFCYAMDLY
jgi:hypothetical protein